MIKAFETVKRFCKKQYKCNFCIFRKDQKCLLNEQPQFWNIEVIKNLLITIEEDNNEDE